MKRVLSPEEIWRVKNSINPDIEFAKLWTQKEAVLKLQGDGIDEASIANILNDFKWHSGRHEIHLVTKSTTDIVISYAFETEKLL